MTSGPPPGRQAQGATAPTCELQTNFYQPIISVTSHHLLPPAHYPHGPAILAYSLSLLSLLIFIFSVSLNYYIHVSGPHMGLPPFPSPPFIPVSVNKIFKEPNLSSSASLKNYLSSQESQGLTIALRASRSEVTKSWKLACYLGE